MGEIWEKALPGFVGLREFFRRLPERFKPVALEDADIDRFRKGILSIGGSPRDYLDISVWAWFATAKAYEVRRYSDGTWVVRFGVRQVRCDGSITEYERQLTMAFDAAANMKFYTLMDGTGLLGGDDFLDEDIEFRFSRYKGGHQPGPGPDNWARLHDFIQKMDDDEFFVLSDRRQKGGHSFFQALCERHGDRRIYMVEYALESYVWHFSLPELVSRKELERLVDVFRTGGYPALQDATTWRRMNVESYWSRYRKGVFIDQWLKVRELRAQAEGDSVVAEKCRSLLGKVEEGRKALSLDVDGSSTEIELKQIKRRARDRDRYTAAERSRMRGFLALMEMDSRKKA